MLEPTIPPAQLAATRAEMNRVRCDLAKVPPDAVNASGVCHLKSTIDRLAGIVEKLCAAVLAADQRAEEIAAKSTLPTPTNGDGELQLIPLDQLEVSAKDGRSIQRRCT